ncbi:MAG TPA: hypothetical protein PK983_11360 [Syntrophales bacterium]|nr:hypothetical protein [Syntrophales bacterium]
MRYLPTVTEVISPFVDFSRIPPNVLQMAADRGTSVHDVCLNFHAKGMPFVGEIQEDAKGYIESFDRWLDQIVADVLLVERRLFDEAHGFCGQIDLLVKTKQAEIWLPDLKTPLQKSRSWRVQMAAYLRLCNVAGYEPKRSGSLRLRKDGKVPMMDWYEESAAQDFNIFLSALNCHRFFKAA